MGYRYPIYGLMKNLQQSGLLGVDLIHLNFFIHTYITRVLCSVDWTDFIGFTGFCVCITGLS